MKFLTTPSLRTFFLVAFSVFPLLPILPGGRVFSQTQPVGYVNPTAAASGMTSGLENGVTRETINMMQIRASAQEAERAAAAAAMARSAESAIEEQNLNKSLARARETRRLKREAAERLKWERATAQNAYKKVSQGDMSTWKDSNGRVKVERGLPPEFVLAVREEEARAAADVPKRRGFGPFKAGKKIANRAREAVGVANPVRDNTGLMSPKPLPPAEPEPRRGFHIPKIKAPKLSIPKLGNRNSNGNSNAPPPETPRFAIRGNRKANNSQPAPTPAAPPTPAPTAAASPYSASNSAAASPKPAPAPPSSNNTSRNATASSIPARSGAALLKKSNSPAGSSSGNQTASAPPTKKSGFFSRNREKNSSGGSSRFFTFGKKKPAPPAPSIDTGLFPAGAVTATPEGAAMTNYTPVNVPPSPVPAPAPSKPRKKSSPPVTSSVSLPGSKPEKEKKFSLPKPKIPTPKTIAKTSGQTSPTSTVNRNGNSFYVVNGASQFMQYGESKLESTISAIQPGTVVMMTKPGADWATVQLSNGSTGIIQTKNLRAASGAEIPSTTLPGG